MRVALIRHPAPLIGAGICYGRLDLAIDPTAEPEVDRIAADPALRGMLRVFTSPARRCRQLADAVGAALAVPLVVDSRLQELDFGMWEGQPWDAVARVDLDRWAESPLDFAPPGGESGAMLISRIEAFCLGLRRLQQDSIVVSHGGPLKVLIALLEARSIDLLATAPPMGSVRIVTCSPTG
ncbi:MAG: alpha-ribazole phosphatase [Acetobacteraceae bacterium]|jgi:alpha-ribazole phosphatase|nr:alpha-ribazole phosphatase [Acetobacteraceae bacterium]